MRISVGIVTYNRSDIIGKCLDSLSMQTRRPDEVIVVDSSSDNKTGDIVDGHRKSLNIIYKHIEKRCFLPQGRRVAVSLATSEIIAFMDDDCIASETWLEGLEEGFRIGAAAVGGPCIETDGNLKSKFKILQSAKNQNFFTRTGDVVCKARQWIPPAPVETTMLQGGNMSFLVKKLAEIGGFDNNFNEECAYREDSDVFVSLIKKGYKILYMPKALVYHLRWHDGGEHTINMARHYYLCGKNHRYFADKHFSRLLSRLSWITFSRSPPSLPLGILLAVKRRRTDILNWYRGLFGI